MDEASTYYDEMIEFVSNKKKKLDYNHISVCVSGNCKGADEEWINQSLKNSRFAVVVHAENHKVSQKQSNALKIFEYSDYELSEANQYIEQANSKLKRNLTNLINYQKQLLQRNYFQIKFSNSLYAVSEFDSGEIDGEFVNVNGGTAWAMQMFIDSYENGKVPLYFYCQDSSKWYTPTLEEGIILWSTTTKVPPPSGIYTGIGTRKIQENGKKAIKNLF